MLGLLGGGSASALWKTGGGILAVLLVVPMVLRLFIVTVDEGWAAIRTCNGRPIIRKPRGRSRTTASVGEVVVIPPGSHPAFPLLYWYRMVDVRCRAKDLPARQLTSASGVQHLVHPSFEWKPRVSGRDLRVFELDVVDVEERVSNIVGSALRDVVAGMHGDALPSNGDLSALVVDACRLEVAEKCGVDLLQVTLTGDAITDGYLLSQAIRASEAAAADARIVPVRY